MVGFIVFAVLVVTSVAAWINTKIIIDEIDIIKKHLGIQKDRQDDLLSVSENNNEEKN